MRTYNNDHQHDADIRQALHKQLLDVQPACQCYDEFDLVYTRADCVLVNTRPHLESLTGFEIKSATDNLKRLPAQVKDYSSMFKFNWLVVSDKHYKDAVSMLPWYWGVMIVTGTGDDTSLMTLRTASPSPVRESRLMVRLLWKEETIRTLKEINASKGVLSKPRIYAWDRLAGIMTPDELDPVIVRTITSRTTWRVD